MPGTRKNILKKLIIGYLAAVIITLAGMLLIAAALIYLRMSDRTLVLLNQLLKLISVVAGVRAAVERGGENGLATGTLLSLFYMATGYALYVALGGGSFSVSGMLGEMLICCADGAVTGAVRANLPAKARRRVRV